MTYTTFNRDDFSTRKLSLPEGRTALAAAVIAGKVLQWRHAALPGDVCPSQWYSFNGWEDAIEALKDASDKREFRLQPDTDAIFVPVHRTRGDRIMHGETAHSLEQALGQKLRSCESMQANIIELGLDPEDGSLRYVTQHPGADHAAVAKLVGKA